MNSFKRAVYKTNNTQETESISCNDSLQVSGSIGIYEIEITIGTDTGETGIEYNAFSIPDRFQLIYDEEIVADSLYVGGSVGTYKDEIIGEKTLDIFEYNGSEFIKSGRTENIVITEDDITNSITGKGTLLFQKEDSDITTMKLRAIGALQTTLWNMSAICPRKPMQTPSIPSTMFTPIYYERLPSFVCQDIRGGRTDKVYSRSFDFREGIKLYRDKQLIQKAKEGYYIMGEMIHEVNNGEITDSYPCKDMSEPERPIEY